MGISISIHAPRVGSDPGLSAPAWARGYFNPRSPCGERLSAQVSALVAQGFQSTLPVWGATKPDIYPIILQEFQSTLPVWGATGRHGGPAFRRGISIHAPRVGSDVGNRAAVVVIAISIHAPRVGSDWRSPWRQGPWRNFNPRSPCGERPASPGCRLRQGHFNPRSPCGERPQIKNQEVNKMKISIHAPRVGSDHK